MARHRLSMGLLLLRLSLGGFMLVWALEKFVNPETTVAIFEYFYMIEINVRWAYILGIPHVALCLMMIAGAYRTVSYGSLMLLHLIGTATTWKKSSMLIRGIWEGTTCLLPRFRSRWLSSCCSCCATAIRAGRLTQYARANIACSETKKGASKGAFSNPDIWLQSNGLVNPGCDVALRHCANFGRLHVATFEQQHGRDTTNAIAGRGLRIFINIQLGDDDVIAFR